MTPNELEWEISRQKANEYFLRQQREEQEKKYQKQSEKEISFIFGTAFALLPVILVCSGLYIAYKVLAWFFATFAPLLGFLLFASIEMKLKWAYNLKWIFLISFLMYDASLNGKYLGNLLAFFGL